MYAHLHTHTLKHNLQTRTNKKTVGHERVDDNPYVHTKIFFTDIFFQKKKFQKKKTVGHELVNDYVEQVRVVSVEYR